ncbi:uncharacterized protein CANTADRAFT_77925, partial [Suhomyces tanzawaensis NRRL Y-17324]
MEDHEKLVPEQLVQPTTTNDSVATSEPTQPGPYQASKENQKESLMKKLEQIPLKQLKEIITNQIDLEIRLKHQELKLTESEIGKIESQMLVLRKFFDIPNDLKISSEPNEFTLKYFDVLNKSLAVRFNDLQRQQLVGFGDPHYSGFNDNVGYSHDGSGAPFQQGGGYRTRSTTSSLRPSYSSVSGPSGQSVNKLNHQNLGCLYRRTDGIIVKLTCPDCQRSNFSSAQGFLNHSRIAHAKEYTSQDAAALKCGEILPQIKQDPEGEASIQSLKDKNLDPNKNLNVNEIYFNGLSNTLNTVHDSISKPSQVDKKSPSVEAKSNSDSPKPASTPKESELLKKVIKEGKIKKEDYQQMIAEAKETIPNAHLFENEVDEDESNTDLTPPAEQTDLRSKLKRRTSRGGINIS